MWLLRDVKCGRWNGDSEVRTVKWPWWKDSEVRTVWSESVKWEQWSEDSEVRTKWSEMYEVSTVRWHWVKWSGRVKWSWMKWEEKWQLRHIFTFREGTTFDINKNKSFISDVLKLSFLFTAHSKFSTISQLTSRRHISHNGVLNQEQVREGERRW